MSHHTKRRILVGLVLAVILSVALFGVLYATPAVQATSHTTPPETTGAGTQGERLTQEQRIHVDSTSANTIGTAWQHRIDPAQYSTNLGPRIENRSYTYLVVSWDIQLRPTTFTAATYEASITVENATLGPGCNVGPLIRNAGGTVTSYSKRQACPIQGPIPQGERLVTLSVVQATGVDHAVASIEIINHETIDVTHMDITLETSALIDLIWLFWAAYAVLVYKLHNPPVRIVAGLLGYSALFLPLSELQWGILFAAQSALTVMILMQANTARTT